jgi:predicted PhzF superfamily epimerase YddE/YHI9
MRTPIFQVDVFTTRRFAGNPATVMPLVAFLDDVVSIRLCRDTLFSEIRESCIAYRTSIL